MSSFKVILFKFLKSWRCLLSLNGYFDSILKSSLKFILGKWCLTQTPTHPKSVLYLCFRCSIAFLRSEHGFWIFKLSLEFFQRNWKRKWNIYNLIHKYCCLSDDNVIWKKLDVIYIFKMCFGKWHLIIILKENVWWRRLCFGLFFFFGF